MFSRNNKIGIIRLRQRVVINNILDTDAIVNRVTLMQILTEIQTQSEMPVIARAQLTQLQLIAKNTGSNVEIVGQIYDLLHKVENGAASLKVK